MALGASFEEIVQALPRDWTDMQLDLRILDEHAIRPGAEVRVVGREPFGGALVIDVSGERCPIGPDLAARMLIEVEVGAGTSSD